MGNTFARFIASLLAFVFIFSSLVAVTPQRALADPNPCTVSSDGAGGWIVSCTSAVPPQVISPINTGTTYNGGDGGGGSTGAVAVSPSSGGDGGNGQSPTLDYFPAT